MCNPRGDLTLFIKQSLEESNSSHSSSRMRHAQPNSILQSSSCSSFWFTCSDFSIHATKIYLTGQQFLGYTSCSSYTDAVIGTAHLLDSSLVSNCHMYSIVFPAKIEIACILKRQNCKLCITCKVDYQIEQGPSTKTEIMYMFSFSIEFTPYREMCSCS